MFNIDEILSYPGGEMELAEKLCNSYEAEELEALVEELQHEVRKDLGLHSINPAMLLFEILCLDKTLSTQCIFDCADTLFVDSLSLFEACNMFRLMNSHHGGNVHFYVMASFKHSVDEGEPLFVYAAAAITAIQWMNNDDIHLIHQAREWFLHSNDQYESILGIAILSLVTWHRLWDGYFACNDRYFDIDEALIDTFARHLKQPSSQYQFVVNCIEDLVLLCDLDTHLLADEEVIQTAIKTLEDSARGAHAETLLSLLPLAHNIEAPHLLERYVEVYSIALDLGDLDKMMRYFRILIKLQSWDCNTLMAEWQRLTIRMNEIDANPNYFTPFIDRMLLKLFRYTCCELMQMNEKTWLTKTPDAALNVLLKALPDERKQRLETLADNWDQNVHCVTNAIEAAEIILYCQNAIKGEADYHIQTAIILANHAKLCCEAGSAIIVRWFNMLCRLANSAVCMDFYQNHKAVLDRPSFYENTFVTEHRQAQDVFDLATFFQQDIRLIRGIKLAKLSGNDSVVTQFYEQAVHANNFPLIQAIADIEDDIVSINQLETNADRLVRKIDINLEILYESMENQPMCGFEYFYDDVTVVSHALRTKPSIHPAIFGFGYGGCKEVVLDAIAHCGTHIMVELPYAPIRHDTDVLLEAILALGQEIEDD